LFNVKEFKDAAVQRRIISCGKKNIKTFKGWELRKGQI